MQYASIACGIDPLVPRRQAIRRIQKNVKRDSPTRSLVELHSHSNRTGWWWCVGGTGSCDFRPSFVGGVETSSVVYLASLNFPLQDQFRRYHELVAARIDRPWANRRSCRLVRTGIHLTVYLSRQGMDSPPLTKPSSSFFCHLFLHSLHASNRANIECDHGAGERPPG